MGDTWRKVNRPRWMSASWSISCLLQDMKISVSLPSQKTRPDEGGYSRYVLLETPQGRGGGRGAEVADAARFAEAAENERNPHVKIWKKR